MPTSTVEDYLKRIYQEEPSDPDERVPTGQIALSLGVTPGTATSMMKTLADSGLVRYEPYSGVRLTDAGRTLAAHVIRRHRLVELFLVRVMGMSWIEVHDEAEVLEHAVSDRLIETMDEMLGRPAADPHGDPIPTADGTFVAGAPHESLLACPVGVLLVVARVTDQREAFLRLVEAHGLMPGRALRVRSRDEWMDTVDIESSEGSPLRLGFGAAARILVARADPGRTAGAR